VQVRANEKMAGGKFFWIKKGGVVWAAFCSTGLRPWLYYVALKGLQIESPAAIAKINRPLTP
jgi:hypothetical protein